MGILVGRLSDKGWDCTRSVASRLKKIGRRKKTMNGLVNGGVRPLRRGPLEDRN